MASAAGPERGAIAAWFVRDRFAFLALAAAIALALLDFGLGLCELATRVA